MPDPELVKLFFVQLPNFAGLLIALYLMREQNRALLELLRQCSEQKLATTSKDTE